MKKILQIGMTANYGGIESWIFNLYKNIDRTKFEFVFINMERNKQKIAYEDQIISMGGKVIHIPARRENWLEHRKALKKIISRGKYSVIHNNLSSWSYVDAIDIGLKYSNSKIIVHAHSDAIEKGRYLRKLFNLINRRYNRKEIIRLASSDKAGKWMFGTQRYTVIPNGISVKEFSFKDRIRIEYREKFNLENKDVFLHVGRLSPEKNQIYIINLFNEIQKKDSKAVLYIVGDGNLRNKLETKVRELNIADKVHFLGVRNDVSSLMQMSDCFLFSSFNEGLGIVLIEAQATGLPCLVSNTIPKEAFISNFIEKMNINETPQKNRDKALDLLNLHIDRKNSSLLLRKNNFDLENAVQQIERVYLS